MSSTLWAQPEQKDNLGREFYVAFGPNTGGEPGEETENDVSLYITSKVPTSGRVEIPALNFDRTFTSTPGQITTIPLPNGNNSSANTMLNRDQGEIILKGWAVKITALDEVAVFGMNHKRFSTDAFMALPVDVLGTEYRVMSYPMSHGQGAPMPSQFMVIGVEDGTNVTIIPKSRTWKNKPANTPIDIVLNRGDVYLVQSSTDGGEDLTGSLIESDRAIAVISGHERAAIPEGAVLYDGSPASRDHLVEQLPPVSAWGDSAFVVPNATAQRPDVVRILSAEDNNTISINGAPVATLNAGQFYEIKQLSNVAQVQATNPVLIGQFAPTSLGRLGDNNFEAYGDPAMALVFPVEQFTNTYTIVSVQKSAFTGNFVNIVVEASGVPSMRIDGAVIPATEFSPIPGTTYMYAQVAVSQGTHNLTGDKPFGVTVYAFGGVDSYSYTGGTLTKTITPLRSTDLIIDFRDRVIHPLTKEGYFDTTVTLKNTSTEIVNVFDFPRRTQDVSKFWVISPSVPYSIAPAKEDSMTIRFEPKECGRRMHTQITAKTDHLRAYVVDVYGRGVCEENITAADSGLTLPIQEIDFGYFSRTDPPEDSIAFLGNIGLADLEIIEMDITGPNAADFEYRSIRQGENFVSLPFVIAKSPNAGTAVELRFTPGGADGFREAWLNYKTKMGMTGRVRLIANILTIEIPSVQSAGFAETPLCKPGRKTIKIVNPNSIPMRVDSIIFKGMNPNDFMVDHPVPFEVPPRSEMEITIVFQPEDVGDRSAQAYLYFNIPKGLWRVSSLSGSGSKYPLEYHVPKHIHILTGESFRLPIYADVDLSPFQAKGYTLHLRYDPTHLEDVDIELDRTLSENASIDFGGDYGERILNVTLFDDVILQGGGREDARPLIVVKFRSFLAEGEKRLEFQEEVPIHYNLSLKDKQIEDYCIAQRIRTGIVSLDSTCAEIFVEVPWQVPEQPELEQIAPNPSKGHSQIRYYVPGELPVRLELIDEMGRVVRTVVDEIMGQGSHVADLEVLDIPSGTYTIRLGYGDRVRTRRMILTK
ncbi:MAG TPA: T9SS type A sorting domain-containing protein [Candidatus Kapabacteria bacterium]|nr:T9SS type A sorting domain-containing protein [Candidatus Kapabacteria bacterium]